MPLQSLPTEVLVNIFGWSDSFRTAAALGATNGYFHSIWTGYAHAILRSVARVTLIHPQEANVLADCYEEIFNVRPTGNGTADAVRRAKLLILEQRILRNMVGPAMGPDHPDRYIRAPFRDGPAFDKPEDFLKLAYPAIILIISRASYKYLLGPILIPQKVFRFMRLRDLRLLPWALYTLSGHHNETTEHFGQSLLDDLTKHFRLSWPREDDGAAINDFMELENFLIDLYYYLLDGEIFLDPTGTSYLFCMFGSYPENEETYMEKVDDMLASASQCEIEGDCWMINLAGNHV